MLNRLLVMTLLMTLMYGCLSGGDGSGGADAGGESGDELAGGRSDGAGEDSGAGDENSGSDNSGGSNNTSESVAANPVDLLLPALGEVEYDPFMSSLLTALADNLVPQLDIKDLMVEGLNLTANDIDFANAQLAPSSSYEVGLAIIEGISCADTVSAFESGDLASIATMMETSPSSDNEEQNGTEYLVFKEYDQENYSENIITSYTDATGIIVYFYIPAMVPLNAPVNIYECQGDLDGTFTCMDENFNTQSTTLTISQAQTHIDANPNHQCWGNGVGSDYNYGFYENSTDYGNAGFYDFQCQQELVEMVSGMIMQGACIDADSISDIEDVVNSPELGELYRYYYADMAEFFK